MHVHWKNRRFWSSLAGIGLLAVGVAAFARGTAQTAQDHSAQLIPVRYTVAAAPPVSAAEAQRAISSAKDLSTAFRVAADRVLPSLVTVETTSRASAPAAVPSRPDRDPFGGRNPFEGTPFEDMFKDAPFGKGFQFESPRGESRPQQGMGSGVIIDRSGLIVTNNHVVAGGENVEVLVRLSDGREFKAASVWTDPKTDIALVKIDGADELVAATLGNSDQVAVGDWVLALGQPFGLESTVTAGIISATHRGIGINARENFLQTDAAINPGNSGGPLVNLDGEVIGINTAISSRGGGNDGVGFAVPIDLAKWVTDQLRESGSVRRAYLGIGIQPVTAQLAQQFHVKPREGVLVTEVYDNTPAAKAGLQAGDVIVEYAGVKVSSPQELQVIVERSQLGRPHELRVMRDETLETLTFVPEEQPSTFGDVAGRLGRESRPSPESSQLNALGLEISALTTEVAEQLGVPGAKGVVITRIIEGSPAERAGLQSGMVIEAINRKAVTSVDEARQMLQSNDAKEGVLLLVRSAQGSRFVIMNP